MYDINSRDLFLYPKKFFWLACSSNFFSISILFPIAMTIFSGHLHWNFGFVLFFQNKIFHNDDLCVFASIDGTFASLQFFFRSLCWVSFVQFSLIQYHLQSFLMEEQKIIFSIFSLSLVKSLVKSSFVRQYSREFYLNWNIDWNIYGLLYKPKA